jgi:hypothetical protein
MIENAAPYDEFREEWLVDVKSGNPSTTELGHRFARKIVTQWLDISEDSDDITYCDGAGDGGIDLAYLHREDGEEEFEAHTWYLVQSKYGSSFQGAGTILLEGQKIIETLSGNRSNLSSLSEDVIARLKVFLKQASDRDRIILVFCTTDPIATDCQNALNDIRVVGQNRIGTIFDVCSISIKTIHEKTIEVSTQSQMTTSINANVADTGNGLLVGTVSLIDLYNFLKQYQKNLAIWIKFTRKMCGSFLVRAEKLTQQYKRL